MFAAPQGIINHLQSIQDFSVTAWALRACEGCILDRAKCVEQTVAFSRADRRDRDIRVLLHQWLSTKHVDQPGTAIIHEFEIPRPSARVDIALINGRISGYEIKGAADTLTRLDDQEPSFSSVFERMSLVVAARHLPKATSAIPDWWEIIETDGVSLWIRRRGKSNPDLSLENLLHVLTRAELLRLQSSLNADQKNWNSHKSAIIAAIVAENRPRTTKALVRDELKRRPARPPS
jgi:hypothetical protein